MVFNFNIDKTHKKIKRDKINYILSLIHIGQYTDKKSKDRYVNVNQQLLKEVIGKDGISLLKDLVKGGQIECDGKYKLGQKSLGYRINYNLVPKKGIKAYDNKYYTKTINMIEKDQNLKLDYNTKLIIDYTKMMFNNGKIGFGDNVSIVNKIVSKYRNESYDRYWSQKVLVDKILSGDITTVADKQGARIYTNYSNLSKDIRKYLLINGEGKVCIDISNSQLQTLCLTLMNSFDVKDKKFYNLVFDGKIYEYFVNKTNISRDNIKRDMLNWLYAENYVSKSKDGIKHIEAIMKYDFKEIYDIINDIKDCKNGGSKLAKQMQLKESSVIKSIQVKLLKNGVDVISLHDSFYLPKSTKSNILDFIERELIKAGYTSVKREYDKDIKVIKTKALLKKIKEDEDKRNINKYLGIVKEDKQYYMMGENINNKTIHIENKDKDLDKREKIINFDDYYDKLTSDFLKNNKR